MTAAPLAPELLVASSSRGLLSIWFWFVFGVAGTFFPHLLARDFLDEPSVVRWIAVPMMLSCGVLLADYYFQISKGAF